MLGRRHLRVRVSQALYTWFQSDSPDQAALEQEMFSGTKRFYDLYISLLALFTELAHQENLYLQDISSKFITRKENFFRNLNQLHFVKWLSEDEKFKALALKNKISWQNENDLVAKIFFKIRNSEIYKKYTQQENPELNEQDFLKDLYVNEIQGSDLLKEGLEEKSIWWTEGLDYAHTMVLRTLKSQKEKDGQVVFEISPLFRDEEDDKEFMSNLFRNAIKHDDELKNLVSNRTQNWDIERIAMMDIILMKMALAEVLYMPNIPIKVSINEYIDISKDYSTPNSKVFINGVLDKIIMDLRNEKRIVKTGRGLIES
jgi:N utilization substance protein B